MKRIVVAPNQRVESSDFNNVGISAVDNLFKAFKFSLTFPSESTLSGVPPDKSIISGLLVIPDRAAGANGRRVYVQAGVFTMPNGLGVLEEDKGPYTIPANTTQTIREDIVVAKLIQTSADSAQRTFINTTSNPPTATTRTHASSSVLVPQILIKTGPNVVSSDELEIARIIVQPSAQVINDADIIQLGQRRRRVFTTDESLGTAPWSTNLQNPIGFVVPTLEKVAPPSPVMPIIIPQGSVAVVFSQFTIIRAETWTPAYQNLPFFNIEAQFEEFGTPTDRQNLWKGGVSYHTIPESDGLQFISINTFDVISHIPDPSNPTNLRRFRPTFTVTVKGKADDGSQFGVVNPVLRANIETTLEGMAAIVLPIYS